MKIEYQVFDRNGRINRESTKVDIDHRNADAELTTLLKRARSAYHDRKNVHLKWRQVGSGKWVEFT